MSSFKMGYLLRRGLAPRVIIPTISKTIITLGAKVILDRFKIKLKITLLKELNKNLVVHVWKLINTNLKYVTRNDEKNLKHG